MILNLLNYSTNVIAPLKILFFFTNKNFILKKIKKNFDTKSNQRISTKKLTFIDYTLNNKKEKNIYFNIKIKGKIKYFR